MHFVQVTTDAPPQGELLNLIETITDREGFDVLTLIAPPPLSEGLSVPLPIVVVDGLQREFGEDAMTLLREIRDQAMTLEDLKSGARVRHFRGTEYTIVTTARHTEEEQILVIYRGDDDEMDHARPLYKFLGIVRNSPVSQADVVFGGERYTGPRFKLVTDDA